MSRKYLQREKNLFTNSRIRYLVVMANHPKNRKTKHVKAAFGGPETFISNTVLMLFSLKCIKIALPGKK
jgi:hypothetical protein